MLEGKKGIFMFVKFRCIIWIKENYLHLSCSFLLILGFCSATTPDNAGWTPFNFGIGWSDFLKALSITIGGGGGGLISSNWDKGTFGGGVLNCCCLIGGGGGGGGGRERNGGGSNENEGGGGGGFTTCGGGNGGWWWGNGGSGGGGNCTDLLGGWNGSWFCETDAFDVITGFTDPWVKIFGGAVIGLCIICGANDLDGWFGLVWGCCIKGLCGANTLSTTTCGGNLVAEGWVEIFTDGNCDDLVTDDWSAVLATVVRTVWLDFTADADKWLDVLLETWDVINTEGWETRLEVAVAQVTFKGNEVDIVFVQLDNADDFSTTVLVGAVTVTAGTAALVTKCEATDTTVDTGIDGMWHIGFNDVGPSCTDFSSVSLFSTLDGLGRGISGGGGLECGQGPGAGAANGLGVAKGNAGDKGGYDAIGGCKYWRAGGAKAIGGGKTAAGGWYINNWGCGGAGTIGWL